MCIIDNCKKRPYFNYEYEKKALYCLTHKLNNMLNIKDKKCIYEGCKTIPIYNYENKKKALYCLTHKLDNMINIKSKTCIYKDCKKIPNYNYEDESKALYCVTHKLDNMIDIKSKNCIYQGCKIQPTYNNKGDKKALYCAIHKLDNMVNVKSKTCIYEGCKVRPNYNYECESKALYCVSHKLDNMIDINHKTCIYEDCKKIPSYNYEDESKALYCSTHKLDNMVDIHHKTCKSEWCKTYITEKYDGYCLYCYINLFPDKPVSRNYKTKEYSVVEFVKNKFPEYNWISDKKIKDGCSRRRPDLLLDLGYQVIIVEIDENQHIDYDCSCENKRLMELSQDLDHRPIVFIRFNPDDYKKDGLNITSCWGNNKKGITVIKKSKKDEWIQRLNSLEEQINYWIYPENITNKTVEIIQLFYNT
jgi:hypothetical protein